MQLRASALVVFGVLAGCAVVESESEAVSESSEALGELPLTAGPLVNAEDNFRCDDIEGTFFANSVNDVQRAVRYAASTRRSLKVSSTRRGGHSGNGILCPASKGIVVNVAGMQSIALDANARVVTVGPGVVVDELSEHLASRGYAIETMADYTGISVAGAVATSAHGSSLRIRASMASLVTSMTVVDGLGKLRTLTGATLDVGAAHGGWLGAVVELKLRVVPQFKLRYGDEIRDDNDLSSNGERLVRGHDYGRIHWFPEHRKYVLDYFDRVSVATPGQAYNDAWQQSGTLARLLGDLPSRLINDAPTEDVQCTISRVRSSWWIANWADAPSSARPVGFSQKMLGGTCAPGKCAWDGPSPQKVRSVEIAFPLARFGEWATDVRAIVDKGHGCFPLLGLYLRFSKGSNVALDMAEGADTVLFEIHVLQSLEREKPEMSSAVYDEIQQLTLKKYAGRPHWGKNEAPTFIGVGPRAYRRWNDFEALRKSIDPAGLFDNTFRKQVAGTAAPLAQTKACSPLRECVCQKDSDCGDSLACSPGLEFTDARVCRKASWTPCHRDHDCASGICSWWMCREP